MKSNLEKLSQLERKLNIEIPNEVVRTTFENVFKGIQKHASIKGFRQGKAPIATIKSLYSDRVRQDVAQELIQKHYPQALREHNLEPISYPEFEFDNLEEGGNFSFTAAFEIRPQVVVKKFEGLEVEKETLNVGEDRIQQVLENIRSSRAQLVPMLEDRPAQMGDVAVIDFEGFVDGAPLQGGAGQDHNLELGGKQFIDGFEEGIVGMKIGQTKTLSLKFPDPYQAAELAGKPVDFKVTLKTIKKKDLPELNDAFVSDLMAHSQNPEEKTLSHLKETIRKDIEQSETKRIKTDLKNSILKALVKANPVDVPPSMLKEQQQVLVDDMKQKMKDQGMSDDDFAAYVNKWTADFSGLAAEMIQSGFLIDTLAKDHNLSWTKEDLENKFQEFSKQTGLDVEKIRDFYSQPEQQQRITYSITEDKVIDFLLSKAKVKEVAAKKNS